MTAHNPDDRLRTLYSARQQRDQENLLRVFGDPEAEQMLGAAVTDYLGSPEHEQDAMDQAAAALAEAVNTDQEGNDYGNDEGFDAGPDSAA